MASTERRASPPTSSGSSKQQQQHVSCDQTTVLGAAARGHNPQFVILLLFEKLSWLRQNNESLR